MSGTNFVSKLGLSGQLERETGLEPATPCLEGVLNDFPPFTLNLRSKSEADASLGRRSLPNPPFNIIALPFKGCKCKRCDVGVMCSCWLTKDSPMNLQT